MSTDTTWTPEDLISETTDGIDHGELPDHTSPDAETFETPELDTEEVPAAGSGKTSRGTRTLSRAAVRRVSAKTIDVDQAPSDVTRTAAYLLGVDDDPVSITTALMSAGRSAQTPVNDLRAIADADPMEAGVIAATMDRPRLKAVWGLLGVLGIASSSTLNESDTKAALRVVRGVSEVGEQQHTLIDATLALLRKN
ncbi:hypothetical protein [Aeromicrobium sp. CTD01-1L150]|uniref:hypothetical protein n=1 Tax=Aeromicrobium sp. CTD01-1L150 TaxID=3341830 RepID=UPI0035C1F30D